MFKCVISCMVAVWCVVLSVTSLPAAEPFGLPDCVADFGSEVLLNAPMLEAMIMVAEPGGSRPNLSHEKFFIVAKHYVERSRGLLLITRQEPTQRPLLLTNACAPYPEAPVHIRTYFADLTEEQHKALMIYRDLIWPRAPGASARPEARVRPGAMARIPAGRFKSGDGQEVHLNAFAIDVHEVTNAQYRQFIDASGYTNREFWSEAGWAWLQSKSRRQPNYWDNEQLNAPSQPVVGVTWYEAEAYCRWAGKALPTELQWEKACRGDDGRTFPWGNQSPSQSSSGSGDRPQFTAPVGSSPQTQSPYGVHDLAGNVLEWTQTGRDDRQIVLCGGSGSHQAQNVGCGVRYTLLPGISANFIGFRCQSTTAYRAIQFSVRPRPSGKRAGGRGPQKTGNDSHPLPDEGEEN